MKKTVCAGIGGKSFTMDEDAYQRLDAYLKSFQKQANMGFQSKEVMDEVESRISDLFDDALSSSHQEVVNIGMVNSVIAKIGMPDGNPVDENSFGCSGNAEEKIGKPVKRFYRDMESKAIGGVCSGLAAYFDIDVTIVRIITVAALFCGTAGFWLYVIFWIVAPPARTAIQKCEMRGIPATAENIRKYSSTK